MFERVAGTPSRPGRYSLMYFVQISSQGGKHTKNNPVLTHYPENDKAGA
jgi:hypothetical protein